MTKRFLTLISGLCLTGMLGCRDFLLADNAINDPNNPTAATKDQLLVGAESNLMGVEENHLPQVVCEWMQQCGGIGGRFVDVEGAYVIQDGSFEGSWDAIYSQGGLVQLRQLQAQADATKDLQIKGIAEVMEAIEIATAADVWGDIPYREALTTNTPVLDPQLQVYNDLILLLNKAIVDLTAGSSATRNSELFFGGSKAKWLGVANTMKARIYLHTVEKLGPAQYDKVIAAASAGISAPDGDLKGVHTTATGQQDVWYQFQQTSFGSDLVSGALLVNLMKARNDTRLPSYFGPNTTGGFIGYDVTTGDQNPDFATIVGAGRNAPTFAQPYMTYVENQLILAEAYQQRQGVAAAQPYLDQARSTLGFSTPVVATLDNIMTEKYIALFQNLEAWNDYKRTCLPARTPAVGFKEIPGRVYYPQQEQQVNKDHVPTVEVQRSTNGFRNPNDPNRCP